MTDEQVVYSGSPSCVLKFWPFLLAALLIVAGMTLAIMYSPFWSVLATAAAMFVGAWIRSIGWIYAGLVSSLLYLIFLVLMRVVGRSEWNLMKGLLWRKGIEEIP